jgi:ribonuclease-3
LSVAVPEEALAAVVRQRIGVAFKDDELLHHALCHRSAVPQDAGQSYERLEFLGDAVLGFVICDWLYRTFPDLAEGEMAKRRAYLASEQVLAEAGREAAIEELIYMGATAEASGDRQRASICADVVEALVGAVYLDRGVRAARGLVRRLLRRAFRRVAKEGCQTDSKTRLQELTQARWGVLPTYEMSPPEGEPHKPTFTATVRLGEQVLGIGSGPSKKAAQQQAASAALENLKPSGGSDD